MGSRTSSGSPVTSAGLPGGAAGGDDPEPGAPSSAATSCPPGATLSPNDDARAIARAVIRRYLDEFAHEEAAARTGELEAVHRLHVATRRLRSALRLFGPVLPAATVTAAAEGFAWLGRGVGAVRDLDVLTLAVTARGAVLDARSRDALAPLQRVIDGRREGALSALVAQLDLPRTRRLLARLGALADGRPAARGAVPLGDVARTLLRPLLRGVLRAGRALDDAAPPPALHRVRVRIKELRYAYETLQPGDHGRRVRRRMARLQDVLGEHQDAVTQSAWLRTTAVAVPLPVDTVLAMGAIIHVLHLRAGKRRRRFAGAWRRFDRPRMHRALIEGVVREAP